MRVRGYGVRPSNNGYSGQERSGDEFNRSYKAVRYTRAEEYATRDVKEFHHYPEQKDLTEDDDDKKQQQKDDSKNSKNSHIAAVQQIIAAIAGAAIIATSYQTAMAKRAQKQVDDTGTSVSQTVDTSDDALALIPSWEWGENNESAVLILKDSSGNIVAKIPATVTTSEEAAKCTVAGKMTYTASAEYEGESYTDTRDKELPALGHDFDSGTEVTLDNGETAVNFKCKRCGEHFVVQNSLTEE